ncbi:MAG: ribonuclease P [Desulfurococcales archaeon]|nr:ribonuclease P [Desulfurococcales archaeon]
MSKRRKILRDLAIQRMDYLYKLAYRRVKQGDYRLARRYIEILLRISQRTRIRPPRYIRRGYCRRCCIPLIPGVTSRVRIQSEGRGSRVVVTCLLCGWKRRYMIKTGRRK